MHQTIHTDFIFDHSLPFEEKAIRVFRFQYGQNPVFRRFCDALGVNPDNVTSSGNIPMLPVEAFRDAECTCWPGASHDLDFRSSGTTGMQRSHHRVRDASIYETSVYRGFNHFYGLDNFVILAYTPGYADNPGSSLIWMLQKLISSDKTGLSRFHPIGQPPDPKLMDDIIRSKKRLMLFGAAFGLMDLAEEHPSKLPPDAIIIETGGMKTHRREISRKQMHSTLSASFDLPPESIHSEYGMTELLSQAWMQGQDAFRCPPWMKVAVYDPDNPLQRLGDGSEGRIGITDLANIHSCSFLMTGDAGLCHPDGSFEVFGRMQNSNLRGCNFQLEED